MWIPERGAVLFIMCECLGRKGCCTPGRGCVYTCLCAGKAVAYCASREGCCIYFYCLYVMCIVFGCLCAGKAVAYCGFREGVLSLFFTVYMYCVLHLDVCVPGRRLLNVDPGKGCWVIYNV